MPELSPSIGTHANPITTVRLAYLAGGEQWSALYGKCRKCSRVGLLAVMARARDLYTDDDGFIVCSDCRDREVLEMHGPAASDKESGLAKYLRPRPSKPNFGLPELKIDFIDHRIDGFDLSIKPQTPKLASDIALVNKWWDAHQHKDVLFIGGEYDGHRHAVMRANDWSLDFIIDNGSDTIVVEGYMAHPMSAGELDDALVVLAPINLSQQEIIEALFDGYVSQSQMDTDDGNDDS